MGIRPEDVHEAGPEETENVIESEVTVYELLGILLFTDCLKEIHLRRTDKACHKPVAWLVVFAEYDIRKPGICACADIRLCGILNKEA